MVLGAQDEGTAVDLEWGFDEEVTDPAWSPYSGRFPAAEWMPQWPAADPAELTQLSVGEAAPQWSCGRCDSFATRGFDDGQIPEHHRTCRHAGVGAGPQTDALAATDAAASRSVHEAAVRAALDLCDQWAADGTMSGHLRAQALRATLAGAGVTPPTTVRSDLTGLGAREAGLTVYPATDARSTDQDVTG